MRFHGWVGFVKSVDRGDGVWVNEASEVETCGDVTTYRRRWQDTAQNGDLMYSSTSISVPLSSELQEKLQDIRYVKWNGHFWCVSDISETPPRVNLSLGGVYRGFTARETS